MTDVSVGFRPLCWCPFGWAPTWRLLTNLYKFGWNTSANSARIKSSRDLILGEVVYIAIIYHIPDSWIYLLNGYDFLFWSHDWWKPRIVEFSTFYQNSLHLTRVHCATLYQSQETLPEWTVPRTQQEDSSEKFCFDLPVKLNDVKEIVIRLTFTTLAFVFYSQYVKVCKSGRLIVTSFFKLSVSFFSSLASVLEFSIRWREIIVTEVYRIIKTKGNCRTRWFRICYDLFLFIQTWI